MQKGRSDISSNRSNWNNLSVIQEIPELHIGKAQNKGITESSHIGRCTHNAESADVKVQKTLSMRNNITCGIILRLQDCGYIIYTRNRTRAGNMTVNALHKVINDDDDDDNDNNINNNNNNFIK
jgi:hypothetical protein